MPVRCEKVDYRGWPNSYRLSNGVIELVAVADIGPRIIHLSFTAGRNVFRVIESMAGRTGGNRWKVYGGHRFWHGPEDKVWSYQPDNGPIRVQTLKNALRLIQPVEKRTRLQKTIEVRMSVHSSKVRVTHRLRNRGRRTVERAGWGISVMQRHGTAVLNLPRHCHPDRLLPNRRLAFWPYTDPGDPRIRWEKDRVLIRQRQGGRLKVGVHHPGAWVEYREGRVTFRKRAIQPEKGSYPDFDSTCEAFTNAKLLELETVGPLIQLRPGAELVHVEEWELRLRRKDQ